MTTFEKIRADLKRAIEHALGKRKLRTREFDAADWAEMSRDLKERNQRASTKRLGKNTGFS